MSLLLKGSPSRTIYKRNQAADTSGVSVVSVFVKYKTPSAVSAPFTFLMDSNEGDTVARSFYIRQDSLTQATLGWITANGNNEYAFTTAADTDYRIVAIHDEASDGEVRYYVNSTTASFTESAAGAAINSNEFLLRILSSSVIGEDIAIIDLATLYGASPDASLLSSIMSDDYLGTALYDAGCRERPLFVGSKLTTPTTFKSAMADGVSFDLEQESSIPDPKTVTGALSITRPSNTNKFTLTAPTPGRSSPAAIDIDVLRASKASFSKDTSVYMTYQEMENLGYYDRSSNTWVRMPPKPESFAGWQDHIHWLFPTGGDSALVNGTYVCTWEGDPNADIAFSGGSSTTVTPNRIEAVDPTGLALRGFDQNSYVRNLRVFYISNESLVEEGRTFSPQFISLCSGYDNIECSQLVRSSDMFISKVSQFPKMGENWENNISPEAQFILGMEADTEVTISLHPLIGATRPESFSSNSAGFQQLGRDNFGKLDMAEIASYMDMLVAAMDNIKWPIDKNFFVEYGGNIVSSNFYTYNYGIGFRDKLNEQGASLTGHAGSGYLSAMFIDYFNRALVKAGRGSQAWKPLMRFNTGSTSNSFVQSALEGMTHYFDNEVSSVGIGKFHPSVDLSTDLDVDYNASIPVLGNVYGTRAEYYSAVSDAIANDPDRYREEWQTRHLNAASAIFENLKAKTDIILAAGMTNHLVTWQGGNMLQGYNSEWGSDQARTDFIIDYNRNHYSEVLRYSLEAMAVQLPGAYVTNTEYVGDVTSTTTPWYEASSYADISSEAYDIISAWKEYTGDSRDTDTIWANYQTTLAFAASAVDTNFVTNNYTALNTAEADVDRGAGSIFGSYHFDDLNFDSGVFYYQPTFNGSSFDPVLENGNFTGAFVISGKVNTITTMYYHDTVNDDWYEFDIRWVGNTFSFTVNNSLNVAPSSNTNVGGIVYGDGGQILSGQDVVFSNDDGSTWSTTITLVSGTTQWRKTVTANAATSSIDTFDVAISDGVITLTDTADVITTAEASATFANASESFTFAENITAVIATFTTINGTPIYSLDGADAGLFSVNSSTGEITPVTQLSFENPVDTNGDGVFEFDLVATDGANEARLQISATITDVAEHVFAYADIVDQTAVIPGDSVVLVSQLTGGIAGETFTVSGMESSTDGGSTYSTSEKSYVAGQTYIRFTETAPGSYSQTVTVTGTLGWSSATDSVDVSFDIVTKAPIVQIDLGADVTADHTAGVTVVSVDNSPVAGDGTITYAITGGADSALFTINATTGQLSFVEAPIFDDPDEPDNQYVVQVTATNDDGFSTTSDTKTITLNVANITIEGSGLPDFNLSSVVMSDGSWSTNQNSGMKVVGTPQGNAVVGSAAYHDVIRFVKHPKARTLSISSIDGAVNATAAIAFSGKYIRATKDGAGASSVDLTITDDNAQSISFTYNLIDQ